MTDAQILAARDAKEVARVKEEIAATAAAAENERQAEAHRAALAADLEKREQALATMQAEAQDQVLKVADHFRGLLRDGLDLQKMRVAYQTAHYQASMIAARLGRATVSPLPMDRVMGSLRDACDNASRGFPLPLKHVSQTVRELLLGLEIGG